MAIVQGDKTSRRMYHSDIEFSLDGLFAQNTDNCNVLCVDTCWKVDTRRTCITMSSVIGPFISTISLFGSGCV